MAERINWTDPSAPPGWFAPENRTESRDIPIESNRDYGAKNPFVSPSRDNYQTYPYDYFTGTDCKIFFGDIWVDDIVTIQYNVSQNKAPLYGYASQTYDAIAKGQVLVQGTLTIAFKEVGYLNTIQYTMEGQRDRTATALANQMKDYYDGSVKGTVRYVPQLDGNTSVTVSANGTPQIIRQEQTIEDILSSKHGAVASGVWKDVYGATDGGSKDFEDFVEALEDTIWGDSNGKPYELRNVLRRVDEFDYKPNGGILIGSDNDYSQCLNILLTFGDINDFRAEHTMVALNDVHFTNSSLIVTPDGNPVGETYQFFARDINRSIEQSNSTIHIGKNKFNFKTNAEVSKLEDINSIETKLNGSPQIVHVAALSHLSQFGWTPTSELIGQDVLAINKSQPYIDQLTKLVETIFNNSSSISDKLSSSQWLVEVYSNEVVTAINMVLEQTIPNTRTYKVIAPARDNYLASNVLSRDDIWNTAKVLTNTDIAKANTDKDQFESTRENNIQYYNSQNKSSTIPSGIKPDDTLGNPDYKALIASIHSIHASSPEHIQKLIAESIDYSKIKPMQVTKEMQKFADDTEQIREEIAKKYNVNPDMIKYNMMAESANKKDSISPTGALGYAQFTTEGMKAIRNSNPELVQTLAGERDIKTLTDDDLYDIAFTNMNNIPAQIEMSAALLSANINTYKKNYGTAPSYEVQRAMYVGGYNYTKSENYVEAIIAAHKFKISFMDDLLKNTTTVNEQREQASYQLQTNLKSNKNNKPVTLTE